MRILATAFFLLSSTTVFSTPAFDLETALANLPPERPATLRIPEGTWRLPDTGLVLRKLAQITIEGEGAGATLLSTNYERHTLAIDNCSQLTLRNLTLDCEQLPFTQGTITSVDPEKRSFTFDIHDGYPNLDGLYAKASSFHLFSPKGTGPEALSPRWKDNAPDYYAPRIQPQGLRSGVLQFTPQATGFENIATGDRIALPVKRAVAILMTGSAGVKMEDVTIHSASGAAVIIRFCEDAGHYTRLRVIPGPPPAGATEPRLLSTCADGFNVAYTRRGPVLDRCEFAYQGDDSVNLHGVVLPVLKWIDDRTYLSMRPQKHEPFDRLLRSGDAVRFLRGPSYAIIGEARIDRIESVEESFDEWAPKARALWPTFPPPKGISFFRIRLDRTIPEVPADTWSEIPASSAPGYVIRDSYFHDHRARSLRLMTEDGLIERNRFERIKGVAISIGPEFALWREAGWARNIVIRGNTLISIGQGENLRRSDSYTTGAISVISNLQVGLPGSPATHPPCNQNILIDGNLIDGCSLDGISVCAASDVRVTNNTIRDVNRHPSPEAGRLLNLNTGSPISVTDAVAEISGNYIEPRAPIADP